MTLATPSMPHRSPALMIMAGTSLLLSAAIFGFFYAWICSTMWGLDTIDPQVAIAAMNGMNGSVRNVVFAPAFFGTPIALWLTAGLAAGQGRRAAARWFAAAGVLYVLGGIVLTLRVNVPMNEGLMANGVPETVEEARAVWQAYSPRWQAWNSTRTVVCGVVFVMGLIGFSRLMRS